MPLPDAIGATFLPTTEQATQAARRPDPVQQAIQIFSLRLPKVLGPRAIAPMELLAARPGARGGPSDSVDTIVNDLLRNVLRAGVPRARAIASVGLPPVRASTQGGTPDFVSTIVEDVLSNVLGGGGGDRDRPSPTSSSPGSAPMPEFTVQRPGGWGTAA